MRRTLVSGLLLAAVAGCSVVNPQPMDWGAVSRQTPPQGYAPSWQQPTGTNYAAARPGNPAPSTIAAKSSITTQSAYAQNGTPAGTTNALVASNQPAPSVPPSATSPATIKQTGLSQTAPAQPVSQIGYSEVVTDPDGTARTLPPLNSTPVNSAPGTLPTSLTAEKPAETPPAMVSAPAMRLVNSKRFTLNYEIKDGAPGDSQPVDLWCTQDLHTWKKWEAVPQGTHAYVVEVPEEGTFGFTLVARSGHESGHSPASGDQPQVWVTVDTTRPTVKVTGLELSLTSKVPSLILRWNAQDKNFGPRPVTLSYATQADGPWTLLAQNVENTGRYEWPVSANVPASMYVRVEATDLVGNLGSAQTPNPVRIDPNWVLGTPAADAAKAAAAQLHPVEPTHPEVSIVNVDVNTPTRKE